MTANTGTGTGALQVTNGGAYIAGNIYIGGNSFLTGNTSIGKTNTNSGYMLDVSGAINTNALINTSLSTESNDTGSGALKVSGGAGIGGNLYIGGNIYSTKKVFINDMTANTGTGTGALQVTNGGAYIAGNIYIGGNSFYAGNTSIGKTNTNSGYMLDVSGTGNFSGALNCGLLTSSSNNSGTINNSILNTNATSGTVSQLSIGQAVSTNNSFVLGFNFSTSGSTTNWGFLGHYNTTNQLTWNSNGFYIGSYQAPPNGIAYKLQVDGATYLNGGLTINSTKTLTLPSSTILSSSNDVVDTSSNQTISGFKTFSSKITLNGGDYGNSYTEISAKGPGSGWYSQILGYNIYNGVTTYQSICMNPLGGGVAINKIYPSSSYALDVSGSGNFTGILTCSGGLSIPSGQNLNCNGNFLITNIGGSNPSAVPTPVINQAGTGFGWNQASSGGTSDFVNFPQGGGGGFNFYLQKTNASVGTRTLITSIDSAGLLTPSGGLTIPSGKIIDFGAQNPTNCMISLYSSPTPTNSTSNFYGFGIDGGILRYQVIYNGNHVIYTNTDINNTTPLEIARFNSSGLSLNNCSLNTGTGNITTTGITTTGSSSISGYLTTNSAASTYAPKANPIFSGTTTTSNPGVVLKVFDNVSDHSDYGSLQIVRSQNDLTRGYISFVRAGNMVWQFGYIYDGIAPANSGSGSATGYSNNFGIFDWNYTTQSTSSSVPVIAFFRNGGVGINKRTLTSGYMLDVYGAINATSYNASSDYRIKENIKQITTSIDVLNPIQYYNKNAKKEDMGFIAHEIQEHFPFLVSGEKDGKDMQSLNYTGLIALLTKEIQDLKKDKINKTEEIQTQKQEIEVLKKENQELKSRLDNIELLLKDLISKK
jgi:FtsZ-binding cell division protein ZapB